jgi:hypothetical protein
MDCSAAPNIAMDCSAAPCRPERSCGKESCHAYAKKGKEHLNAFGEAVSRIPVRAEAFLIDGDIQDIRDPIAYKKGASWPSPRSRRNTADLEAALSGGVDELAKFGMTATGIVILKVNQIKRAEDLDEIDESMLKELPLSPDDFSIIFALRKQGAKTSTPSSTASESSAWAKCYDDLESTPKVVVGQPVDSGDGANDSGTETKGWRCPRKCGCYAVNHKAAPISFWIEMSCCCLTCKVVPMRVCIAIVAVPTILGIAMWVSGLLTA